MNIKLIASQAYDAPNNLVVEFITSKELGSHKSYKLLNKAGFKAKQDSICSLYEKNLLMCGIEDNSSDNIRSAATAAIKSLKTSNYKSASIAVEKNSIKAVVDAIVLGGYEFNKYKTKKEKSKLKNIYLTCNDVAALKEAFEEAVIIADATCYTRDIVNVAPDDLNPPSFAKLAKKLARKNSLECTILGEKELKKEKCEAMLAVGRASYYDTKLLHLAYKPKNPKKIISLVGKGLTYDSGGLSLKPATSMVTMKMDKAGACAVLGIIKAVSELKLDIEVHAFVGAVENMIGGNAYKPDDVLTSRKGDTIEVRNTDAEGRLVLADVLDYAQENVESDYLFDFATLTGACMVALGQYTTGVMGHSNRLRHDISKASGRAGELTASLPFNKYLKKQLKSEIADICNISNKPYGGAITAGLFLDNFIKEENKNKWLHFDIAGSAYTESPWDVNVYGGTGAGVRFMSEFLKSIK
ncbi:leucyl aminopeptidase [Sulfurimonas autotrophica]|uniref:Probable cytosol aminopeptidase n=1 Tax=Sulfurimonas autotrophica (strain ATCC BAA-671 / DSM 16294 / JCM 11897 / OK10) TaxID=563040 RepID=E0UT41_SULAO|nr:leucyl aminopeptidase [Sulfurimonas autotrophica]ADN09282.1 Leucyl aminopeptidase [Sulfurimonas autotrophica DSM 16294]